MSCGIYSPQNGGFVNECFLAFQEKTARLHGQRRMKMSFHTVILANVSDQKLSHCIQEHKTKNDGHYTISHLRPLAVQRWAEKRGGGSLDRFF
jgi:hypothetical protein